MKAQETRLLEFIRKANQFVIPIYQRNYSWDEKQCQQLWEDIIRVGKSREINAHFVGSIVYVQNGLSSVSLAEPLLVIDGQQRLTTITILLEALARALDDDIEPLEGFTSTKIRHHYLTNQLEKDDRYFKLILSDTDRETLKSLVRNWELPAEFSLRIKENFDFFAEQIKSNIEKISEICSGIAKLIIVDIALNRDQDNPQLIFESMNSTGKALSEADLIRNFILMGLEPDLQNEIYRNLWRPMELDFGQEAYGELFDDFMRHYLTIRTGEIPRLSDVYEAFKEYRDRYFLHGGDVSSLVSEIRKFSKYFVRMALGKEIKDIQLAARFNGLFQELDYSVALPFALEMLDDFESGLLSKNELLEILELVETYIFRRSICEIPTNSMNKTFAEFMRFVDKKSYLESVKAHFYLLKTYKRFPTDDEFTSSLQTKNLYSYNLRSYLLNRLENFGTKEPVNTDNYSIEHIMPQNEKLSEQWQKDLGEDWKQVWQQYLHTLGNLTLTGYNSEYSDRSFHEKLTMPNGFAVSPLRLNEYIKAQDTWNESKIIERASILADKALLIWPGFIVRDEILAKYEKISKNDKALISYSRSDHPLLSRPKNVELFETLREEILKLDLSVTETYLKYYVAYKSQTNFVDVIPKALGLRLNINLKFTNLIDPQKIAVDVTGKGRWGNGDVSVNLRKVADIPYVLSLIKQALVAQLEN